MRGLGPANGRDAARLHARAATLERAEHLDRRASSLSDGARAPLDLGDHGVVVARVVVGQRESLHAGCARELHDVLECAVPPALPPPVFLGRVLRVVDDEIGVGQEMGVPAVALVQDRFERAGRGVRAPEGATERLVVARVDDRGAVGLDAVAERHRGVVEVLGNDPRAADRVRALAQVG